MPAIKYIVHLSDEQREQLIHNGSASARKLSRARILLKANEGSVRSHPSFFGEFLL